MERGLLVCAFEVQYEFEVGVEFEEKLIDLVPFEGEIENGWGVGASVG